MNYKAKADYFNSIAHNWDEFVDDREMLFNTLRRGICSFNIPENSIVVDVGCGTGNLTLILLQHLSNDGKILAVDISEKMIDLAKNKIYDKRVNWFVSPIEKVDIEENSCDYVICYSVWPHIDDTERAILNIKRILKRGGRFIIWHTHGRERINEIHRNIDSVVNKDILLPAKEISHQIKRYGFEIISLEDDNEHFLIIAEKR
ncbi:MAG: class I SAM-dependent methyltransferase [Myxococcota bacterium]